MKNTHKTNIIIGYCVLIGTNSGMEPYPAAHIPTSSPYIPEIDDMNIARLCITLTQVFLCITCFSSVARALTGPPDFQIVHSANLLGELEPCG